MSEFVRVRKDEWESLRKDIEIFIQHYEASSKKVKELTKENIGLREQLRAATERLATTEQKASAELQQTSAVLQKMRANIYRVVQETEKEMKE